MARLKRKIKWKNVLSLVLTMAIAIGAIGGIVALVKNDTKKISASAFERGSLDENGKHVDSDVDLYTKEAFYCKGIRIEPDFEFKGTFDVYYYTNDNEFIEAKTGLTEVYDEDYPLAIKARVVIHVPSDDKDFKIHFWEVSKYAKELKITVNKDQELPDRISANLYNETNAVVGKTFVDGAISTWNINTLVDGTNSKLSEVITIDPTYDYIEVYYYVEANECVNAFIVFADENGNVIHNRYGNCADYETPGYVVGTWVCERFDLTSDDFENATSMRIVTPKSSTVYVYGYEY